jgi:hypothetical protein
MVEQAFAGEISWQQDIFKNAMQVFVDLNKAGAWPEDALNQMHRYRDALIYLTLSPDDAPLKSRPVIGAYVLFPGWFPGDLQDDPARNPYAAAIDEIGIGAFPALPGQPNKWLASFLRKHLGQRAADGYTIKAPDEHLASEPVRIAPSGLELRRSGELVFVAQSGPDRTPGYIDGFRAGTASWYHTRDQALHRAGIPGNVMNDITHCAIAVPDGNGAWRIDCVFNVISTQLCDRAEISAVQAGTGQPGGNGRYWLFRLGRAEKLLDPIILENTPHFTFGIATLDELPSARNWSDVSTRYDYLYAY